MIKVSLESMVERLPVTLYVYAVNHDTGESSFPFVSENCNKLFGFKASDAMENPKLLVNAIVEDEAEAYAAAVMESMEKMTPFDRLGRVRRADGKIIHVHFKSMPRLVEQHGSKLTVWDGIVFDVSRQVSNEENNRTKLQDMMEMNLQPVFETDTRGNVLEWNGAMEKATEYTREEAMGQPVVGFMEEEERGNFCNFFSHAVKVSGENENIPQPYDCVFVTKHERKHVYLHAKCTLSKDANMSDRGLLCCCQDVTMVKEAQKQKDAALKLVDAERGLTEWLSHEVRNPLSVAMEAAVALQEGASEQDENMSYSDLICESIRYVVDLLTNMLDLNKCLDGKVALHPSICKVREHVLVPTCKIMGVRNNKVKLVLADGNEIVASVDSLRLRQVITNLVANALKFTTEGFVRVELNESVSPQGKTMRISVGDSGCGIPPSSYSNLFSKWEKLGSKMNGAGIGLCLSKSLVRAMGGDLYLNKGYISGYKDNPGAQFVVEIPLSSMLATDGTSRLPAFESLSAAVLASQEGKKKTCSCNGADFCSSCASTRADKKKRPRSSSVTKPEVFVRGKFHILVVDDDNMGRRLLQRRFSRLFPDAEIVVVDSGEAALREAEKVTFDLITMDHFMAWDKMNGEETIRALRGRHSDSCIVGISGNSKREEHLSAGAQDFFQKPIPNDEMLIDRLITKISPPSGWKVLCVDDVPVNVHLLCRRLHKVAAPHFTSMKEAEKRWNIVSRSTGEDAIELLKTEWIDLVILDQHLGEGVTGTTVANFVREHAVNRKAVIVLNSGSTIRPQPGDVPYNIVWPKPLPTTEQMRLDLCRELLNSKKMANVVQETQSCFAGAGAGAR